MLKIAASRWPYVTIIAITFMQMDTSGRAVIQLYLSPISCYLSVLLTIWFPAYGFVGFIFSILSGFVDKFALLW